MRWERAALSVLAGIAGLVAAWPLTTLIEGGQWVQGAMLLIVVALLLGIAMRALRVPEWLLLWLQIGAVLIGLWFMFIRGHELGTIEAVRALITEADQTIREFAAPAPETTGLRFAIVALVALLTVLTDAIAVGLRSPAIAGLPLMSLYLVSAANSPEGLGPWYFVAASACWLLMVILDARAGVMGWSNTTAEPTRPMLMSDRLGMGGFSSMARTAAVVAVIGALVVPQVLPSGTQRFLGEGLGRRQGGVGTVGLSNTADLSRSLVSNDRTPVLTYTTDDLSAPPLRVMVASSYSDGQWTADDSTAQVPGANNEEMQQPAGLRDGVYDSQKISVRSSTLVSGLLATPSPPVRANLPDVTWSYDPATSSISPRRTASKYAVEYAQLKPTALPTSTAPQQGFERDLALDPRALNELRRTSSQISGGSTPFDRAVAIQDHLRGAGGFSYSLTLAPTRQGEDGAPVDPLTNFLLTKQGYCVQFASAMIMLARLEGIPARMALGFLAGTPDNQRVYTVLQSDAHAWPELYFPGLGWTRFEPTPGSRSGTVPNYAITPDPGEQRSERPESSTSTSSGETASSTSSSSAATTQAGAGNGGSSSIGTLVRALGRLVAIALLVGLLGALLPMAARRETDRRRRLATDEAQRVEADWDGLRDDLHDLGVPDPPAVSPRAARTHYKRAAGLGPEADQALDRAVSTLERARYAPPGEELDLRQDAQVVVDSVRRNAAFRNRAQARLAPRAGRRWLVRLLQPWRR